MTLANARRSAITSTLYDTAGEHTQTRAGECTQKSQAVENIQF